MVEHIKQAMKPEQLIMYAIVLVMGGGGAWGANALGNDKGDQMTEAIVKLTDVVQENQKEIRAIQIWQSSVNASRYTATDARIHSEKQSEEFTRVYATVNELRRDMISEQRIAGEALVRLGGQLDNITSQINDLKKYMTQMARNE